MRRLSINAVGVVLLVLDFVCVLYSQDALHNACVDATTCGKCLAAAPECGWCKTEDFKFDRCNTREVLFNQYQCSPDAIVNASNVMTPVQDVPQRNEDGTQPAVQLRPQEIHIKLRPNMPYKFNITFKKADNYPVDLYFIMDLSQSMNDDKDKLAELGDMLAAKMAEITRNFRLGFGTFVDKKTMPYVSTVPKNLEAPCTGCAAPFGFRNNLPLTSNTAKFRTEVNATQISGNLDSPEGGFDAIMQAVVCDEEIGWLEDSRRLIIFATDQWFHLAGDGLRDIGWRNVSRRMVLFASDQGFHYAGDGKLGGIVNPSDGLCHLDARGFYSESLNQDYPSISQLATKITEKKVNIIFAVTKNQLPTYEKLSQMIEGSTTGELAENSANIVDLVRDNYLKISDALEMKTENAEGMSITFRAKCDAKSGWVDGAKCNKIGIGQSVTFETTIEATQCPEDRTKWVNHFYIYPVGLSEKLRVDFELICECDCELAGQEEPNSRKCHGRGVYECAGCTCDAGYYGKKCECDASNLGSGDYDRACRRDESSPVCSGRGNCVCGVCDCGPVGGDPSRRYSGQYCHCNDLDCAWDGDLLCGGPERGECQCGQCRCKGYWTRPDRACNCDGRTDTCIASNGVECNGKGHCECGTCRCDRDSFYRGPTCEDCPTCAGRCETNKACVQCKVHGTGELTPEQCAANCTHVVEVDSVEETDHKKLCRFKDEDDCIFFFTYEYNKEAVLAQKTKDCPITVNPWIIVAIVIGIILAIGIALILIWKLFDELRYRREMAKFEEEKKKAKWDMDENPLYKQATSTFQNPTYGKK